MIGTDSIKPLCYHSSLDERFLKGRGFVLYPSINELTPHHESRYSLVIAVSKRARQIAGGAKERGEVITEKPVKLAINDIAAGKVVIEESQEEF